MDATSAPARRLPLMRSGGKFLVAIGLRIVVGGLGPRSWMVPAWITGAGVGVVVMAVGCTSNRRCWMWMLIVVAAHFASLTSLHGPFCPARTLMCLVNAVIGSGRPALRSACSGRSTEC